MTSKQIAFWSLVATVVGLLFAGYQLMDHKPASENRPQSPTPAATDCSAVGASGGSTTINCDKSIHLGPPPPPPFASFSGPIDGEDMAKFDRFMTDHAGHVVKLNLRINTMNKDSRVTWSEDQYEQLTRLIVTYNPTCTATADNCTNEGGTEYVFVPASEHEQSFYLCNGDYCMDGYYSVEPQQGIHQGVVSVGVVKQPANAPLVDPGAH